MNHPVSIPLSRPLLERWARDLAERIACAWHRRRARRELDGRIDAMAELSANVLRDIGASDDLLNRAAARRQAHEQGIGEMRMLARYRGADGRFW